jgi:phage I-like protein
MTKRTALLAAFSAALSAQAGGWQLVLPAGEFSARDGRGPFRTGDRVALEAILSQTRAYHGQTDMVVDYDHQSFAVFSGEKSVSAKAAGWVRQLEARDDGIWANIEWTKAAAEAIEAKEYRYLSPVIPHGKDGQVRIILSVALTNVPATHLEALSATIIFDEPDRKPDMDQILAALGLAKGSGEDAVLSALNAMLAANTAMATALGLDKAAKPAEIQAALTAVIGQRGKLLEAAGLASTAKPEDAIAALAALRTAGAPDPTKFVPIEQVTAMQADLKALKDGALDKEAETAVAEAMRAGKVSPGMKDWAIAHFKADKKSFEKFLEGSPALTSQQLTPRPAVDPSRVDPSNPAALAAAATVYQKKLADAGQTIDFASAVVAVKEGAK